jgi:uncharacterized protein (UPF0297 family)
MTTDPVLLLFYALLASFFFWLIYKALCENPLEKSDRSVEDLYKLVYYAIKDKEYVPSICSVISKLAAGDPQSISSKEFEKLITHFSKNKPSPILHTEFYNHPLFTTTSAWWWEDKNLQESFAVTEQRKKFIAKLANIE